MNPLLLRFIKIIAGFIFAPLAAFAVLLLVALPVSLNNACGVFDAILGISAFVYLVYLYGLVLILPGYLLLRWLKLDTQQNIILLGGGFGLLVGNVLGLILGLPSGYLLSVFLAEPPIN